jgi:uncharacterized protein YndB with AHSA1/START domain
LRKKKNMTQTMATTPISKEQENDSVVTEIFISAPRERVFKALIDREQALKWGDGPRFTMTEWEMDARVGGKWSFVSKDRSNKESASGMAHHGEILRLEPPRLLEYTWYASWHSNQLQETVVRWDLSSVPGGTQVKVTHSGLAQMPAERKGYAGGWPGLLAAIKEFVESGN